jgi:hypothetical protein
METPNWVLKKMQLSLLPPNKYSQPVFVGNYPYSQSEIPGRKYL